MEPPAKVNGIGSSPRGRNLLGAFRGVTTRGRNSGCSQGSGSNFLTGSGHQAQSRPRYRRQIRSYPRVVAVRRPQARFILRGRAGPMNNFLGSVQQTLVRYLVARELERVAQQVAHGDIELDAVRRDRRLEPLSVQLLGFLVIDGRNQGL